MLPQARPGGLPTPPRLPAQGHEPGDTLDQAAGSPAPMPFSASR